MSDTLMTMYVQELARALNRALVAEARIAELEAKESSED